ncbi:MAG: DoxX family protein [Burkholderiales bacterium]
MNSNQSLALLVGRVLMGLLFLVAGIRKTMAVAGTAAYMAKGGVPMADTLVYAAIALEILGGLALIIG